MIDTDDEKRPQGVWELEHMVHTRCQAINVTIHFTELKMNAEMFEANTFSLFFYFKSQEIHYTISEQLAKSENISTKQ